MTKQILQWGSTALIALAMVACSKFSSDPSFRKHRFQTHLEECFANAKSHTKGSDDLFLLSAEKMGTIQNNYCVDSIVSCILSPCSSIIADIVSGEYVISSIENSLIDINNLEEIVREKVMVGMDVYQLTWNYRGQEYTSVAIASDDDGVYYDNIGYQALSFTSQPLIHSDDTWWPGDVDSSVFDPGIAGGDTVALDIDIDKLPSQTTTISRICKDIYGNIHGEVFLALRVVFYGMIIIDVTPTVNISHTDNDSWSIYADINTTNGGVGYLSVTASWYYCHGRFCGPAVRQATDALYVLPQGSIGESSYFTMNGLGDNQIL